MKPTYCRDCGLMRLPKQTTCTRCAGTATTTHAPTPPPQLNPRGLTRFTRYANRGATFQA